MDAISDRVFTEVNTVESSNDDPSLLTVILDISPVGWVLHTVFGFLMEMSRINIDQAFNVDLKFIIVQLN